MVLSEFEKESGELSEIAQNYLDALLNLDRYKASAIIHSSLDEGVSIKDIYIKEEAIISPSSIRYFHVTS